MLLSLSGLCQLRRYSSPAFAQIDHRNLRFMPMLEDLECRTIPATFVWSEPANSMNSRWDNAANWLVNGQRQANVPGTTDKVVFNGDGNTDSTADIAKVMDVEIQPTYTKTIDLLVDLTVSSSFKMLAGKLTSTVGLPLFVSKTLEWTGGIIDSTGIKLGDVDNTQATGTIAGGTVTLSDGLFVNHGILTWISGDIIAEGISPGIIENYGTFDVKSGGSIKLGDVAELVSPDGGYVKNYSLITFTAQGTSTIKVPFANEGTAQVKSGTVVFGSTAKSYGTFELHNSTVNVTDNKGSKLEILEGTITGAGTISGNLELGTNGGPATSVTIRPGIDKALGTIVVSKSFSIYSEDATTHMRVGANGQNSQIHVQTGTATLNGNITLQIIEEPPAPARAIHSFVEVFSATALGGKFHNYAEGQPLTMNDVPFKFSYKGANGKDNDVIIYPPTEIHGRVWDDVDRNGKQVTGESGIDGVTVHLLDDDENQIATTTTTTSGDYSFDGLQAGTYEVQFVLPTPLYDEFSPPNTTTDDQDSDAGADGRTGEFTLAVGEIRSHLDAGMYGYSGGSIGGLVWEDMDQDGVRDPGEPGIFGVLVNLRDEYGNLVDIADTYWDGVYLFGDVDAGTYEVEFVPPPEYTLTTPGIVTVTLAWEELRGDIDAGLSFSSGGAMGMAAWQDPETSPTPSAAGGDQPRPPTRRVTAATPAPQESGRELARARVGESENPVEPPWFGVYVGGVWGGAEEDPILAWK